MSEPNQWKVGELAKLTGASIRALHYYEEVGLLEPRRNESGHRLYGPNQLSRLQQIVSLRQIGMTVDEIRTLLARPEGSPLAVVRLHLDHLRDEIAEKEALYTRLERLAEHLEKRRDVSVDELLETVRYMTVFETYYTEEQLQQLAQRRAEFGEEAIAAVQEEWPKLIAAVRAKMESGTDPGAEEVQTMARRWRELIDMFTGGDPGIRKSLENAYASEPQAAAHMGLTPDLVEYVGRAWAASDQ